MTRGMKRPFSRKHLLNYLSHLQQAETFTSYDLPNKNGKKSIFLALMTALHLLERKKRYKSGYIYEKTTFLREYERSLTEKWNFMVLTALLNPLSNILRMIEEQPRINLKSMGHVLKPRYVTGTLFYLLEDYGVIDSQRRLTPFGKILGNAQNIMMGKKEGLKKVNQVNGEFSVTTPPRSKALSRAALAFYYQIMRPNHSIPEEIITLYQHAIISLSHLPDRDHRIDNLGTVSLPLDALISTFIKYGDPRSPTDLMEWIKKVQSHHPSQIYFEYQKERSRYQYINIMAPIKELK